jgi:hypothetical protein
MMTIAGMGYVDFRDYLDSLFTENAEFRRRKATEYPRDTRNAEAVEIFDKLRETIKEVDPIVFRQHEEIFERDSDERHAERYNEMLLGIGFHWWPNTATEFLSTFIADRAEPAR